ncbi:complex I intermediate-associated protein 30 (CIA30) [Aliiruegeria haliotis]|uniref:Complex I intermediate-associated protein 30 (CIA30) n=1 Tax=Aliiruegeria haliotis TaxID=1280846 RepID=A0A2T0RJ97_9RHOB|nr:CIA30 family protein [Aliiruegeria haliotis]PRY21249.1 complex I intermediate-associated protein 30 (CIA30) [Aliiruegeria haliotis]
MIRNTILATIFTVGATIAAGETAMTVQMKTASDLPWTYVADSVMGGVSQGQSSFGSDDGQDFIRLTGEVSTENRGGFIQVRTMIDIVETDAAGLVLKVRGNGERYFIHLRTRSTRLSWQYYQAGFDSGPDWTEVRLPWAAFETSGRLLPKRVSPETIRSIGLVAYGRDHKADVSLAEIGIF